MNSLIRLKNMTTILTIFEPIINFDLNEIWTSVIWTIMNDGNFKRQLVVKLFVLFERVSLSSLHFETIPQCQETQNRLHRHYLAVSIGGGTFFKVEGGGGQTFEVQNRTSAPAIAHARRRGVSEGGCAP